MSIIPPTLNLVARPGMCPPQAIFTRASAATRVGPTGLLEPVAGNVLRHDYNPATGEYLGWLIEEQRTNAYTHSADFSHADWSKTACSASADAAMGPDGTMTADKLCEDGSTGMHFVLQQPVTPIASTSYSASVFVKAAGRTRVVLSLSNSASYVGGAPSVTLDLSAGTIGSVSAGTVAHGCTSHGNGWYRLWIAGTTTASPSGVTGGAVLLHDATGTSYTGDGASGVLLWGAQIEVGRFPTSYIPTTTAAATRSAEVMTVAATGLVNQTEGTLYAHGDCLGLTGNAYALSVDDGSVANAHFLGRSPAPAAMFITNAGGVAQTTLGAGTGIAENTTFKLAYAYRANDFAGVQNGGAAGIDTAGSAPLGLTMFRVGSRFTPTEFWNGHLRHVAYFPRRLADVDLRILTE